MGEVMDNNSSSSSNKIIKILPRQSWKVIYCPWMPDLSFQPCEEIHINLNSNNNNSNNSMHRNTIHLKLPLNPTIPPKTPTFTIPNPSYSKNNNNNTTKHSTDNSTNPAIKPSPPCHPLMYKVWTCPVSVDSPGIMLVV